MTVAGLYDSYSGCIADDQDDDDEVLYFGVAGDYTLAEGLKVTADVHFFESDRDNARNNDATIGVIGTEINF